MKKTKSLLKEIKIEWIAVARLLKRDMSLKGGSPMESLHRALHAVNPKATSVSDFAYSAATDEYLRGQVNKAMKKAHPLLDPESNKFKSSVGYVMLSDSPAIYDDAEDFIIYIRR